VVQHYTSADLEKHFAVKGAKVIGFQKSGLAQSIYAELKAFRINKPVQGSDSEKPDAEAARTEQSPKTQSLRKKSD
jgi:hypothetical protein